MDFASFLSRNELHWHIFKSHTVRHGVIHRNVYWSRLVILHVTMLIFQVIDFIIHQLEGPGTLNDHILAKCLKNAFTQTDVCLILGALNSNRLNSRFRSPVEIVVYRPLAQFHFQARHLQKGKHTYIKGQSLVSTVNRWSWRFSGETRTNWKWGTKIWLFWKQIRDVNIISNNQKITSYINKT